VSPEQPSPECAIITPSYRPDFELCQDLNSSILRFTPLDVQHHVIVPNADVGTFAAISGQRTKIHDVQDYLPHWMVKVPRMNAWLNVRRPMPPIRGWIAQQIVKLAAAASMTTNVVILIDSDIVLIKPMTADSFTVDGRLALFEVADGIDSSLPRHQEWYAAARRLLGLPPLRSATYPDYICCPCAWSPAVVRSMLARIETVTGTHWATAIGREIHFSEMILYGVYVRAFMDAANTPSSTNMHCLNHYEEVPLDEPSLRSLLLTTGPEDVAVMISAKSGTSLATRRAVLDSFQAQL
jgi:hypothetical protein